MNVRKILRIARWEVTKSAGTINRRTIVLALAGTLLGALVGPQVLGGGVALDQDIYRVGVAPDSPYRTVVERNAQFTPGPATVAALEAGEIDVLVRGDQRCGFGTCIVYDEESAKSRAAYSEFRSAIAAYNDAIMDDEPDRAAAFPVGVTVRYVARDRVDADGGGDSGAGGGGAGDGGAGDGTDGVTDPTGGGDVRAPLFSGGVEDVGGRVEGDPSGIEPPFPFGSLVLAFLFIVPMNFVIQAYGSSIMDERINRRGELLLVSPVTRVDVVAGKTLPYLLGIVGIASAIALGIDGGYLSVAAVVPIGLLFLAATFVGAMFARSFKELTFVTVTISVFLTAYAFVPAIFADVTPIALISPLTIVVRDLQNLLVEPGEYAFSVLPVLLTSVLLFALGTGVYREEDMFTQKPVHRKAVDAVAVRVRGRASVALISALSIPFVFAAELLAVALLFALPYAFSLPVLLVSIAAIEELAKSIHLYAGYTHERFDRSVATAVVLGALSGLGFFLGEKFTLVTQLVGLPELRLGRAAFAGVGTDPLGLVALLLAPLVLHATTATISALGARRDARWYAAAWAVAVVVHTAYNAGVMLVVR